MEALDTADVLLMTEARTPASILDVVEPFLDIGSIATDLRGTLDAGLVFTACAIRIKLGTMKLDDLFTLCVAVLNFGNLTLT